VLSCLNGTDSNLLYKFGGRKEKLKESQEKEKVDIGEKN
jgi:hypothetical protein